MRTKRVKSVLKNWIPISWTHGTSGSGILTIYMKPIKQPELVNSTFLPFMQIGASGKKKT